MQMNLALGCKAKLAHRVHLLLLFLFIFPFSERNTRLEHNPKMFKNHLAMIGMNETPNKKAKFWQSYIRSLKGKYLCGV